MTSTTMVDDAVETPDAERSVVGALLLAADDIRRDVLDALADDDVADPRCRFVLAIVRRMVAEGVPVDPVTVMAFVESHALPEPSHGHGPLSIFLWELSNAAPVPMSGTWYARAVVENAVRRRAVGRLRGLAKLYQAGDVDQLNDAVQDCYAVLTADLARLGGDRR